MAANPKQPAEEAQGLRLLAFCGVATTTIAAMCCIVFVPMIYNHMQHMHTVMLEELDFCRLRSTNIWREVARTQVISKIQPVISRSGRIVRSDAYGNPDIAGDYAAVPEQPIVHSPAVHPRDQWSDIHPAAPKHGGCCGCGVSPRGLPGSKGEEGRPGDEGHPGPPGVPGEDTSTPVPQNIDFCFDCPEAREGPPGKPGPYGPLGNKGQDGEPGPYAENGEPGPGGETGPPGNQGDEGRPGRRGKPGVVHTGPVVTGPPGPSGRPGRSGPRGEKGEPGENGTSGNEGPEGRQGKDGRPGNFGLPGETGEPGDHGPEGGCDHCAIPRTQPGY